MDNETDKGDVNTPCSCHQGKYREETHSLAKVICYGTDNPADRQLLPFPWPIGLAYQWSFTDIQIMGVITDISANIIALMKIYASITLMTLISNPNKWTSHYVNLIDVGAGANQSMQGGGFRDPHPLFQFLFGPPPPATFQFSSETPSPISILPPYIFKGTRGRG